MKKVLQLLVLAAALVAAAPALAQSAAVIEAVQMPAWVERGGQRTPLVPGMELFAGDRLVTGGGSRILVKLAEGSLVKLGENGSLQFTQLDPTRELFKSVISVLEGAFRFTTDVAAKARRREISFRVANVTAGIRGTDLWGKSAPDREIVCLIEGAIEIAAPGDAPLTLDQPRQFYRRENGRAQPVGLVDPAQLAEWAKETEIEAGRGSARRGGRWQVSLATADNQGDALRVYDEVRAAGYPAEIRPAMDGEKRVYTVRIRHLPGKAEAEALASRLRGKYGVAEPKVSR